MTITPMELRKQPRRSGRGSGTDARRFLARRDPAQLGQARRCIAIAEREMMLAESCGNPLVEMRDALAAARFVPMAGAETDSIQRAPLEE
jgi:hypothetical protein